MELTPLRYFSVIARTGHLTRAARLLGVTQPALSAMLKKLELEVGSPLLHRTGRGVDLTEAGRVFLEHAEEAIRAAEGGVAAVREIAGLERGSIRVGGGATATGYLLPPVVRAMRRRHPGLRFYIREAGSSQVAASVLEGDLDIVIVTLPVKLPSSEGLIKIPLVSDELRLIVPPGHSLGAVRAKDSTRAAPTRAVLRDGFRWRDLAGEAFVAFEAGTAVRELIDHTAAKAGVTLNVVMELRSIESIKQMVGAGIGVALVSRFALEEGEGFPCREGKLSRGLAIVRRRDRAASPGVDEFQRALLDATRTPTG